MTKTATARRLSGLPKPMTIAEKFVAQQRALEAGKAGYKRADELLDELEADMKSGIIKLNKPVDLGNGQTAVLSDKFAEKSRVGAGLSVRRYEVEISRAADVTAKL